MGRSTIVWATWAMLCMFPPGAGAQPLSEADRARVLDAERLAVETVAGGFLAPGSAVQGRNAITTGPQYVTGVKLLPPADSPAAAKRVAEVTRYMYAGGITVHTYVDVDAGRALSLTPYANFPTPLSPEEVDRAIALAADQVPAVALAISEMGRDNIEAKPMTVIVSSPSAPDYGHRISIVHFKAKQGSGRRIPSVHVDLTAGKAYAL